MRTLREVRDTHDMTRPNDSPTQPDAPGVLRIDPSTCATVSLADAARVLGVHRSTAWELHKRGEFPLPVIKVGTRLRVAKVHLETFVLGESA